MLMTREQICENFSAYLRGRIRVYYRGRLPSAAMFALHFNGQTQDGSAPISQETARRWLRGNCLPDETRLQVLAQWLDLDLHEALLEPRRPGIVAANNPVSQEVLDLFARADRECQNVVLAFLRSGAMPPALAV